MLILAYLSLALLQLQLDELKEQQLRLNREKVDLENQLEAEQEYIVNKLQKQVDRLAKEKAALLQEKHSLQRHVSTHSPLQMRLVLQRIPGLQFCACTSFTATCYHFSASSYYIIFPIPLLWGPLKHPQTDHANRIA